MHAPNRRANPDDIDIMVIWNAIKANLKRLAIGSAAIGAGVYLILSLMQPQYSSKAQIIIENEQAGFKQPKGSRDRVGGRLIDMQAVKSQAQILQSNDLAAKVAQQLKLNSKPEFNSLLSADSIFAKLGSLFGLRENDRLPETERVLKAYYNKLTVYPVKESRVIAVEFRSQDPQLAASLANELSNTYIEFLQSARVDQNRGAQKWLGQEIDQLRKDVELAEIKLEKMRSSTGLIPGQNNVTLNVQQLGEINSRLSLANARKSEAVARAKLIRTMLREGAIDTAPDVLKSRLIQRLNEQRVRVERQIAQLSATLLPAHPRMAQLRSERAGLRRQIRREGLKIVKGLENEATIADAKVTALLASIKSVRLSTVNQSDSQAKIRVLEREAKSKRELYESYVSRLGDASARQSRLSVPIMARIFQQATASNIPVFPKKAPLTLLAMISTVFLGLVLIVTRELLQAARGNMSGRESLPPIVLNSPLNPVKAMAEPAAAEPIAPLVPASSKSNAIMPSRAGLSAIADRLTGGAINQGEQGYRTLVASEDGLTDGAEQALDLARTISGTGKSVVLIDWQTGAGSLAELLAMPTEPGLRDLIKGRVGFKDILHPIAGSRLHLIPAGRPGSEKDQEGEKAQLELILDALDETYDHILAYGSYSNAQQLFQITEGRFDAGVTLCDADGLPDVMRNKDSFLGYTVEGIDIQHYVPARSPETRPDEIAADPAYSTASGA